ncbi:GNAT family N-acetyltransferase [Brachybacterium sp. FME24]|uniref:GNAT family N-acetyltransferase n=1 Tax=Brachybacterium sp. FME24 TaxID=2742605 RepID=UPI001869165E|nr:GNAT family N-acetyltransferase [Brachybacterium sp. FME24]
MRDGAENAVAGRSIRPATAADRGHDGARFSWLQPDGWREGCRALVVTVEDPDVREGLVIGVGRIGPNRVHPGRDMAELEIDPAHRRRGHGTALLRELGRFSGNPLSDRVVPGSERDQFLRSLGAHVYLPIPILSVDLTDTRTAAWCTTVRAARESDESVRVARWTDLPREQVIDALTDRYLWQHASWSPTASRKTIRPVVGEEFYDEAVLEHCWATVREGRITALVDLYDEPVGPHREGSVEAVDSAGPHSRTDVALCLAALLTDLRGLGVHSLDLDNHPTDPHAAPLLATLPLLEAGQVNLVEIPNGLTAALRGSA